MAHTVRATCPKDGVVVIALARVALLLGDFPYVSFECPTCHVRVRQTPKPAQIKELLDAGVVAATEAPPLDIEDMQLLVVGLVAHDLLSPIADTEPKGTWQ